MNSARDFYAAHNGHGEIQQDKINIGVSVEQSIVSLPTRGDGVKHWIVSEYADPTIQVIVTGEGGWTVYFMDGEKKIPADQIFMSARDFWYHYIVGNEIAADDEQRTRSWLPALMHQEVVHQTERRVDGAAEHSATGNSVNKWHPFRDHLPDGSVAGVGSQWLQRADFHTDPIASVARSPNAGARRPLDSAKRRTKSHGREG